MSHVVASHPPIPEGGMDQASQKKAPPPSAYKYKFGDVEFLKNYHGHMIPYPFYETLSDVEKFQANPSDVAIVTFPKAGTTFMSAIVQMIQNDADPDCLSTGPPLEQKIGYLELTFPGAPVGARPIDRISAKPSPRAYFTHLGYDGIPESILENAKIVYVARNPKDAIVSMHHFARATPAWKFEGTLEDTAETFFNNTAIYSPFYDHVATFWKNRSKHSNIFFTTFERMLKDFKNVVRDLSKFLGKDLTEEQVDTIAYHCNFESMKGNDNVNRIGIHKMGHWDFNISPFMRAGQAGNWKKHFSPELNKKVDEWIASEEKRVGDDLQGFEFEYE